MANHECRCPEGTERLRDALTMPGNGPFTGFVKPGESQEDDLDRFRPD